MRKLTQSESLRIIDVIETDSSCGLHAQDYFEVIYVYYGSGVHVYNDTPVAYAQGDIFLLAPGDKHYFTVEAVSRFIYLKFTSSFFEYHNYSAKDETLRVTPLSIIQIQWIKQDKITVAEPCRSILRNTVDNIVMYNSSVDAASSPVVYYQILSIFGMIREYLDNRNVELKRNTPTNAHIAAYIQERIYSRTDLSVQAIATHFNISPAYFSTYFKRNFGVGYQQYVENLKLSLIKKRLQTGDIKLKEIADEFGFTDVSHLSKFFKRHEGVNPSRFELG